MSIKTLAAENTAATTDESTDDLPTAVEGPYVPREIEGACVIEATAYERTADTHALRYAGSTPTHVVGLCSEQKARDALRADGYSHAEIDRAFENGERLHRENNENAWAAVAYAESRAPEPVTDGGVVETDDLPEIETIEFTVRDNPLRGRCVNCGRDGPVDLDGEFVILHRQDCPRDGVDQ